MRYHQIITLKDGRTCVLRNGTKEDGAICLEIFRRTHEQTDFLLSYPDEITFTPEQQEEYLQKKAEDPKEIEILAEVDGMVVGMAGIEAVARHWKTDPRASFGVSVVREFWGLGIGRALTEACIRCAREAGYSQLELEVVADNAAALELYRSVGFTQYGRNPRGFRSRHSGWQELVLMRLELDK